MAHDFFNDLMRKVFPSRKSAASKGEHLLSEPLKRSESFMEQFLEWMQSPRCDAVLESLREHIQLAREKGFGNRPLQIYESPQSNGFYFNPQLGLADEEFAFVLEHFRALCLSEGYEQKLAERKYTENAQGVRKMDRYYLKPRLDRNLELPLDQLYGNVHLELHFLNEQVSYLKVMAHVYQDSNYKTAGDFEEFCEKLFEADLYRS